MSELSDNISIVVFKEHPIASDKMVQDLFEIGLAENLEKSSFWKNGKFDQHLYCTLLIEKIVELRKPFLSAFLDFQIDQLKHPDFWLNSLELLLSKNAKLLLDIDSARKIHFLFDLIEQKCCTFEQSGVESSNGKPQEDLAQFDIQKVKSHCEKLEMYREREAYLLRMKTNYLQVFGEGSTDENISFPKQIDLELGYLKELKRLKPDQEISIDDLTITWNGKANLLVDFFYQCMHLELGKGEKLTPNTQKEIIDFLVTCFRKRNGKRLSATTLKTYLTPSRYDKRPKKGSWIDLKQLYDQYLEEDSDK